MRHVPVNGLGDFGARRAMSTRGLTFAVRRAGVGASRRAKSVALHRGVRPWLVHAAFALVVSRILRGTCRSRAPLSLYTRPRATRPRRAPFRLFVLCARSSAQRQEHSVAIVRTCRRARFGLRRLRSGAATAFGQTTRAQQPECDRACAWAYRICRRLTFAMT